MLAHVNTRHELPVQTLALHQLMKKIQESFKPVSSNPFTQIVNEIPHQMIVNTSENLLTSVLQAVLSAVLEESARNNIRISAKEYSNLILLRVKQDRLIDDDILSRRLRQAQSLAEALGGCICISNLKGTTISVTFFNHQKVAA